MFPCRLPGLYNITPLPSGITGLAALNPALSALVSTNPGIAAMMMASIVEDEVRHRFFREVYSSCGIFLKCTLSAAYS